MRKIKHIIMSILALTALAVPVAVASEVAIDSAPAASAAVTNCSTISTSAGQYSGRCQSTDANPPYTTQFRVKAQCYRNVTKNGLQTQEYKWVTGAWRNAIPGIANSVAYCGSGWFSSPGLQKFYEFR